MSALLRSLKLIFKIRKPPWVRSGESHLAIVAVLRWRAIWILKTTPESEWGSSDAKIQEPFPRGAGPASGQYAARLGRRFGHCLGGGAVRSGQLRRHGGVWLCQGSSVAPVPAAGARHPKPRYL